jgi:hypothetical protein
VFGPVSQWMAAQTAALLTVIIDLPILTLTHGCDHRLSSIVVTLCMNAPTVSGLYACGHSHSASQYQTGCCNMKNGYVLFVVFAVVCTGRNMWTPLVDRHIHSGNTTHIGIFQCAALRVHRPCCAVRQ